MKRKTPALIVILAAAVMAAVLGACSSVKHVPEGKYLLDKVKISVEDSDKISTDELYYFLRQQPNHKVLGFAKLQLSAYSLSGRDSTKWYNKWLRRVGQPPVIYSPELTESSRRQLRQALINRGYLDACIVVDTISEKPRRLTVDYRITTGRPHVISSVDYDIDDPAIRDILMSDSTLLTISPGDFFDRNVLDNERGRITETMRNHGYYAFNKDNITFTADTVKGSKEVGLTMNIRKTHSPATSGDSIRRHTVYRINDVVFYTVAPREAADTVGYRSIKVVYGRDRYIKPAILEEKCYLRTGDIYKAADVDRTYEALGQLGILKFINIELTPVATIGGETWLDAAIMVSRNKKQGITLELEGTNSEGDLGVGVGVTYLNRNLAHSSELLTVKLRGAYESLSGDLNGLINDRYTEVAAEVGITFPKFEAPFVSKSFKQKIMANTEFAITGNYQERPEYTRVIAGAAWKYNWTQRHSDFTRRHTYDFIDINYVRLPRSTLNLIDSVTPMNPLLRYSYEDHFIMRMGYTYYRTNRRIPTATLNAFAIQPEVSTLRASAEVAGNLLYAISSIDGARRHDGAYKIFGIQFAQYVKGEVDYTYTKNFNSRNALSVHGGFGIVYPYGNSSMVPFEKRFYAGGANGVRGWGVRTLGPGAYNSKNNVSDFINQCGDIRLDMSVEYRAKLFWVFEGALFIDAGNIWTIKDYENQPDGMFKFNKFYRQIALAYGAGIRMDFTYFLLRFDLGLKAYNPAKEQERWPLLHPRWGRDANFHFSVGYPF